MEARPCPPGSLSNNKVCANTNASALRDPVVGGIRPVGDHHALDERPLRQPHEGIRHEVDDKPMPLRHPHRLLLHGARIGVDVEGGGHWGLGVSQDRACRG